MKQRVLTAVLAGILFLGFVIIGDYPFVFMIYLLATIALYELLRMKHISLLSIPGIVSLLFLWLILNPFTTVLIITKIEVAFILVLFLLTFMVLSENRFTFDDIGFVLLSVLYIGIGFYFFIETRDAGLSYVFFALAIVWATDTGAYLVGRKIGKRKLWPAISPNKTVEGFYGGIVSAIVTAIVFQMIFPIDSSYFYVLFAAVVVSIFGQIGDLVESAIKRHYTVKDSGNLLPGHGGILDRFDSLLFVLPMLHFLQFI